MASPTITSSIKATNRPFNLNSNHLVNKLYHNLLFCSHLFEACLKHSGLEMFFYHRGSNSVCAGQTLALCIAADFCLQGQKSPVKPDPESAVLVQTTPPDIFAPLTPPDINSNQNYPVSVDRIPRAHLGGTRIPVPVTPAPGSSEEISRKFFSPISGEESGLVRFHLLFQFVRTRLVNALY